MLLDVVKKNAVWHMNDHYEFIDAQKNLILANIETSTRCTLRCPQCTRAKLYSPKNTSQYNETVQRILNGFDLEISEAEKLLKFFNQGLMLCGSLSDPVFWPHFFDFLNLSKKYPNRTIQIHTAASQKNINWYQTAFSLCHSNIIWRFGIDGLSDTSHLYRKGQNSALMIEAMLLAKSMNLNVEWQYIIFEHNLHQIEDAKDFAKKNKIDLFFIKSDRKGGGIEVPEIYKPKRNKEVLIIKT